MSEAIYDVFISYSSKNHKWVSGLAKALKDCGFSVWWDRELLVGDNFYEEIEKALMQSRCVVTVWSEYSVKSKWVLGETSQADSQGILVPVIYQPSNIPLAFHTTHNADLRQWGGDVNEASFQQLLRGIEQVLEKPVTDISHLTTKDHLQEAWKLPEQISQPKYWVISAVALCVLLAAVFLSTRTDEAERDSSIRAENGDVKIEASGNSEIQVITGDGQVKKGNE